MSLPNRSMMTKMGRVRATNCNNSYRTSLTVFPEAMLSKHLRLTWAQTQNLWWSLPRRKKHSSSHFWTLNTALEPLFFFPFYCWSNELVTLISLLPDIERLSFHQSLQQFQRPKPLRHKANKTSVKDNYIHEKHHEKHHWTTTNILLHHKLLFIIDVIMCKTLDFHCNKINWILGS